MYTPEFFADPHPGVYDLEWLSGPNGGYGFTVASSDRSTSESPGFEDHVRGFLAQVNPRTGYID
jgi:hypothetical protein